MTKRAEPERQTGRMTMEDAFVLENRELKNSYHLLRLKSETIAPQVLPGQFIHIRIPDRKELTLRRPFSIFKAEKKELSVLYKRVGKGTDSLARLPEGTKTSIMGPLGNGFPLPSASKQPVLIAGGYGLAPLYLLAQSSPVRGCILAGGKTRDDIPCLEVFDQTDWTVLVATEDGSGGRKGLVTGLLSSWLKENKEPEPELFACGPDGMLMAVAQTAVEAGLTAWISMDRHMGCGVGACLACVQKIKTECACSDQTGTDDWTWARVCKDGPVFECRKIVWEGNS